MERPSLAISNPSIVPTGRSADRVIGADPIRTEAEIESSINEPIDLSVFDRWRADESYRPGRMGKA